MDAVRGRHAHVGRERRDPTLDPERLRVPRGQLRLLLREGHVCSPGSFGREAGAQDRSCTFRRGQARATAGPNDTNVIPPDGERRVHGLAGRRGDEAADSGPDCIGGQNEAVAALSRLEAHQAGERPRPDLSDVLAAEADRDRGRHELLGVGCRSPGFCGRDCGRLRLERDADRPGAGESGAAKLAIRPGSSITAPILPGKTMGVRSRIATLAETGRVVTLLTRSARAWAPSAERVRPDRLPGRQRTAARWMPGSRGRILAPRSKPQLPWPRHRGRRAGQDGS